MEYSNSLQPVLPKGYGIEENKSILKWVLVYALVGVVAYTPHTKIK